MRVRVVVVAMDRPLDDDAMQLRLDLLVDECHEHRLALLGRRLARQRDGHMLGDLAALLPTPFAGLPVERLLGALGFAPNPRRIAGPFRRVFRQDQAAGFQLVGTMREVEAFAALIEPGVAGDIGRQAGGAAASAGLDDLHTHKPARHLKLSLCRQGEQVRSQMVRHLYEITTLCNSKLYIEPRLVFS